MWSFFTVSFFDVLGFWIPCWGVPCPDTRFSTFPGLSNLVLERAGLRTLKLFIPVLPPVFRLVAFSNSWSLSGFFGDGFTTLQSGVFYLHAYHLFHPISKNDRDLFTTRWVNFREKTCQFMMEILENRVRDRKKWITCICLTGFIGCLLYYNWGRGQT